MNIDLCVDIDLLWYTYMTGQGSQVLPNPYLLVCVALRRWQSFLSDTPVSTAGHTNLAAIQAMQVDENGGWVNLKVYGCD